jgi:hypothetical protein
MFELELLTTIAVFSAVIAFVVIFHYEVLSFLTTMLPRLTLKYRQRIVVGIFGALMAHIVEVWVFALAYFLLLQEEAWGHLEGRFSGTLTDCVYFSFTVYTTLGFGDIQPFGDMRHLAGVEALTGMVLITWTASFLYLEMQRNWNVR